MFVCICNGHRDRDIREVARTGLRCPREIYRQLGKPARCGQCLDFASQLIDEVHADAHALAGADAPLESPAAG
jgi:bacterioferritin-associated ferredoxin